MIKERALTDCTIPDLVRFLRGRSLLRCTLSAYTGFSGFEGKVFDHAASDANQLFEEMVSWPRKWCLSLLASLAEIVALLVATHGQSE